MSTRQRLVVLTNDDGLDAGGLLELARVLRKFSKTVVVAPSREHSGAGHAVTLREVVRARKVHLDGVENAWAVDGTPADCAKLAIRGLFRDCRPAMLVSGINRGPNVGVNIFYSGTVAAALESAINGVPAVAISKEHGDRLSFREAAELVAGLLRRVLRLGLPEAHILNVNIPDRPIAEIKGFRLTRAGMSGFDESYKELPPRGRYTRRFVLEGEMRLRDKDGSSDAEALGEGWVSVTPLGLDLTSKTLKLTRSPWSGLLPKSGFRKNFLT